MDLDLLIAELQRYQGKGTRRVYVKHSGAFSSSTTPIRRVDLDKGGDVTLSIGLVA